MPHTSVLEMGTYVGYIEGKKEKGRNEIDEEPNGIIKKYGGKVFLKETLAIVLFKFPL